MVILIVGWGMYVNVASSLNIDEKVSRKYVVLRAEKAERRDMNAVISNLDMRVINLWKSDIEAQMTGTISHVFVKAGDSVEADQPLCEITNHDVLGQIAAADASVAEAEADYINAMQRANRYIELVQSDAISRADYDTAIAARDAAQARLSNRKAQREILETQKGKLVVRAPEKGVVLKIYAKFGAYIKQGQPLVLLSDVNNLETETRIFTDSVELLGMNENDGKLYILEVKPEPLYQRAYPYFYTEKRNDTLKFNQFYITVSSITPKIGDKTTDLKRVVWKFVAGGDLLEPTIYRDVKITKKDSANVLAVPIAAVNDYYNEKDNYVYTIDDDSCLVKKFVTTGISDDTYVEIKSGIKEGDTIIISDRQELEPGMRVKVEVVNSKRSSQKEDLLRMLFYMMK